MKSLTVYYDHEGARRKRDMWPSEVLEVILSKVRALRSDALSKSFSKEGAHHSYFKGQVQAYENLIHTLEQGIENEQAN